MIIHIRNFGKIESADIDLANMVVFVGENNSGKTYLMQLIYGLFSYFNNLYSKVFDDMLSDFEIKKDNMVIKANDVDFYKMLQNAINETIKKGKDVIIENTFHTNSLSIDSLWVEFSALSEDVSIVYEGTVERSKNAIKRYTFKIGKKSVINIGFGNDYPQKQIKFVLKSELICFILSELAGISIRPFRGVRNENSFIYLPASRSGIMLLYANYLSNDGKNVNFSNEGIIIEPNINSVENEYGLTEPVYNFLMFLLKHKYSERSVVQNKSIITFINNNIINGHFEKIGNTMRYSPSEADYSIPIYLSSSLVSELAPIYQILTGIQRYSFIMYDEIETCQHPTKQLQLARLLIRMVNAGYKMIVSTHSDTMATAINNLLTLSAKENNLELIKKLGYEKEDILNGINYVKAYQFLVDHNGKTKVAEIPSHFSIGVGFDFSVFNTTNDKIYHDAVLLSEVD